MTDEEKKAIENLKKSWCMITTHELDDNNKTEKESIITVLNLIQKQEKEIKTHITANIMRTQKFNEELEKKDKIINKMAEYIEELDIDEDICNKSNWYADDYENGHCEKCAKCIKSYFEKKVEGK